MLIKQYGERRTGTNYLKWLIEINLAQVLLLMHVLGDKHSVPADILHEWPDHDRDAYEWVCAATLKSAAIGAERLSASQEAYLRDIAGEIANAMISGRLCYLISIKNPYAWGASIARFDSYLPRGLPRAKPIPRIPSPAGVALYRKANDIWSCFNLRRACLRFNNSYRAWFDLVDRYENRSIIVRYEDLVQDPCSVLLQISNRFRIPIRLSEFRDCRRTILWTHWDDTPVTIDESPFDLSYYRELRYLDSLTPAMRDVITRTVNWRLLSRVGYLPL